MNSLAKSRVYSGFRPNRTTRKGGVDTTAADSRFTLGTGASGNRNTGHEFSSTPSNEQRWPLIECIKTL